MQSIDTEVAMNATPIIHTTSAVREIDGMDDWTELAGRENEGLEVSLLWSKSANRVKVAVADTRHDQQFEFDVAGADALAAFHHPFAYATNPQPQS
jgi:hypothetical protein